MAPGVWIDARDMLVAGEGSMDRRLDGVRRTVVSCRTSKAIKVAHRLAA
ncbi:MAG: hypothetical protein ABI134_27105 [Byssovorax sp.]